MEIRILGPVEVLDDAGSVVPLAGAKQRALVGVLAVHAGSVVGTGHLIDELWPDDPPATADNLLQGHVSKLRRVLPDPSSLVSRAPGYLLQIPAGGLDAERFEHLLDAARGEPDPRVAAPLYRRALALWRGQALGGAALGPDGQAAAVRLDETRMSAVEEWLTQELACGRHGELVGEIEGLVAAHPFREGLRVRQMIALYRSGRQADALAAYRAAREFYQEELGCEPGTELRRIEQAVLANDPSLDHVPLPVAEPAPPPRRPRRTRIAMLATAAAVAVIAVVTVVLVVPGGSDDAESGAPAVPLAPGRILHFDFDQRGPGDPPTFFDVTGRHHNGHLTGRDRGLFTLVERVPGVYAGRFPAPCIPAPGLDCPTLAIETPASDDLNPGDRDFSFGAEILITPASRDVEANIMQKGAFGDESQWKLRLDDAQHGYAACVLSGVGQDDQPYRALAKDVALADGSWHTVLCRRAGPELLIVIDGTVRARQPIPPGLVIRNDDPVRIGSARVDTNDDSRQYSGLIDNVIVDLE